MFFVCLVVCVMDVRCWCNAGDVRCERCRAAITLSISGIQRTLMCRQRLLRYGDLRMLHALFVVCDVSRGSAEVVVVSMQHLVDVWEELTR